MTRPVQIARSMASSASARPVAPLTLRSPMKKAGEEQTRKPKIKDKRQSERSMETARQVGAEDASDMFDKLIGEMGRNAAFPPCQSCGLAMVIVQIMPADDPAYEDRIFKCPKCGVLESKKIEIK